VVSTERIFEFHVNGEKEGNWFFGGTFGRREGSVQVGGASGDTNLRFQIRKSLGVGKEGGKREQNCNMRAKRSGRGGGRMMTCRKWKSGVPRC